MKAHWLERLKWWVCEKLGHPFYRAAWIYDGAYHKDCYCGRIISEPLKQED